MRKGERKDGLEEFDKMWVEEEGFRGIGRGIVSWKEKGL